MLLAVCALGSFAWADPNSITSYNITWYLNGTVALSPSEAGDYQYGYYPNGVDPWVRSLTADPNIYIGRIDPLSIISGDRTMHGSMIDPDCTDLHCGYDSYSLAYQYQAALNAGRPGGNELSRTNPIVLTPVSSLLSARSIEGAAAGARPILLDMSVLTAVSSAPPSGSFRPPYIDCDKTVKSSWNVSAINQTVLDWFKDWDIPAGWPGWATVGDNFQGVWEEHPYSLYAQWTRAKNNVQDYGRDVADQFSQGLLSCHLAIGDPKKLTLLTGICQLAIDRYAIIMADPDHWGLSGAHDVGGQLIGITLAGKIFDDSDLLNVAQKCGQYAYADGGVWDPGPPADFLWVDGWFWGTFEVAQEDIDGQHKYWPNWDLYDPYTWPERSYVDDAGFAGPDYIDPNLGMPDGHLYHAADPMKDTAYFFSSVPGFESGRSNYRTTFAMGMPGQILAAAALEQSCGLRTALNHEPAFTYMARYMRIMDETYWLHGMDGAKSAWIELVWDAHWAEVADDTYGGDPPAVRYFLGGG